MWRKRTLKILLQKRPKKRREVSFNSNGSHGLEVDLLSGQSGSLILSVLSEKKKPSAALTSSGKMFYRKNPETAGCPVDVSPVPINIQPTDTGKY